MAEHLNLVANKNKYYYEDPIVKDYVLSKNEPRLVAFYLPQFHPIAENDYVWGKNFTEWTNVTSDVPRFVGHIQPFLPKDTGYYDLRIEDNMADQIEMAKKHGLHGFCFYYYWFSGKRLLEKPIDNFVANKDWDFNFSICWANENWTKRWDGRDNEVIVAQEYHPNDPINFIKDVEHILLDPRYIKEDGKPVLTVFRASELKDPARYAEVWREYFRDKHNQELHLVSIISFEDKDPRTYGFDAALDFAPQSAFFKNECFDNKRYPYLDVKEKLLDINFEGSVADYRAIALNKQSYTYFDFPTYKCVTPSWDNDARKKGKGFVMANQSPDIYGEWLQNILEIEVETRKNPLVFINAWNEWAEGAVLEPTFHNGRAVLNRTTQALASLNKAKREDFPLYGIHREKDTELAVIVHLYYPEKWEEIKQKLDYIEHYDLFVTLNEKDRDFARAIKEYKKSANIFFVPNRGRDVLPFLHLARRLDTLGYKYFLKLHSKKSLHRTDGADWFHDVLSSLLPNKKTVDQILATLMSGKTSIVGPQDHIVSLKRHIGSNEANIASLLQQTHSPEVSRKVVAHPERYNFVGGTMFWGSFDGIRPLLQLYLLPEDFESEQRQVDGTLAHAIERVFGILVVLNGQKIFVSSSTGVRQAKFIGPSEKYQHAP
jgi:lipopolysaccharide biosynthesis protein